MTFSTTQTFLLLLGCIGACLTGTLRAEAAEPPARPNIVFILADDLGWGDLKCYGHPYARTPNLDKLAGEGTRFTQYYATGVTCCPARTGLMTGKFPATFAKYPAAFGFGNQITITELLQRHGYATGHFGKWHIGPDTAQGTYGIDVIGSDGESSGGRQRTSDRGRDAPIFDRAIRFIEHNKDRPFYVNVWGHITHHPVNPNQRLVDEISGFEIDVSEFSEFQRAKFEIVRKSGGNVNDAVRRYLADVNSLDQDIGRLLAKLDELGLRDHTVVVFSSDQGPASPRDPTAPEPSNPRKNNRASDHSSQLALNLMGYAGPDVRGGKHTDLEGGVRVPWIVRWPGKVPAGRVDGSSVLSGADWLPSLCAITGIPIEADDIDGEDSSGAWYGGTHVRTKPLFWKTNADKSDAAMRWQNWKFHGSHRRRGQIELYDVAADPGEAANLAQERPELVAHLQSVLSKWTESLPPHYEHGDAKED